MSSRRRPSRGLGACAALVLAGCSSEGGTAPAVRSAAAIVDRARGFELARPGAGWTLIEAAEADRLLPGAAAGATSAELSAVVLVEPNAGLGLDREVDRAVDSIALEDRALELREDARLGDVEARRFAVSGKRGSITLRFAGLVAERAERSYRVLCWGSEAKDSACDPLFDAFSLRSIDSPADARALDRSGAGWRVKGSVLEHAAARLIAKPEKGWRVLVGPELASFDAEADAGLVHARATIAVQSEPCAGKPAELAEQLRSAFVESLGRKAEADEIEASLAGERLGLTRHRDGERVHLHGAAVKDGLCVQVLARHASAERREAERAVVAALSGIAVMSAAASRALLDELGEEHDADAAIASDAVIRGGVLRHFGRRIVWRRPAGSWQLAMGARASAAHRDALANAVNPALGLRALLIADDPGELENQAYHRRVVDGMKARVGFAPSGDPESALGGAALISQGEAELRGRVLRYRLMTRVLDGDPLAVQALVFGRPESMRAHAAAVGKLFAGIEIDRSLRALERTTDGYRDHRLGFSMKLPADWQHDDRTPPELEPSGRFARWDRSGAWIGVLALSRPGAAVAGLLPLLKELLAEELDRSSRGEPVVAADVLAGAPAERLSWHALGQHVDALIQRRGSTLYAVVTVGSDERTLALARDGFSVLP